LPAIVEGRVDARPRGLLVDVDATPFGGGEYGGGGCSDGRLWEPYEVATADFRSRSAAYFDFPGIVATGYFQN
jgi:hypothetical protein